MLTEKIQMLSDLMKENQFLTGGMVTVGFGFFLRYSQQIWNSFVDTIKKVITTELVITTRHTDYQAISKLAYTSRIGFFCRTYSLSFRKDSYDVDGNENSELRPGFGTTMGVYKGKLFWFSKSMLENKNEVEEKLQITFLTRNKKYIDMFVTEGAKALDKEDGISVYAQSGEYWEGPVFFTKRKMETVFVNNNIKQTLTEKIKNFVENKQWYTDRGIPYKLCIMLHGKPGSGKTSLIKALASHFNKDIYYMTDTKMATAHTMSNINKKNSIVLLEDIDTMHDLKSRKEKKEKATDSISRQILHNLLNLFDGFKTPEGAIFILTTNHIEDLDAAIFRPGRVDMLVEMNELEKDSMIEMFNAFYGNNYDAEQVDYVPKTGAQLQKIFLEETAETALHKLAKE